MAKVASNFLGSEQPKEVDDCTILGVMYYRNRRSINASRKLRRSNGRKTKEAPVTIDKNETKCEQETQIPESHPSILEGVLIAT